LACLLAWVVLLSFLIYLGCCFVTFSTKSAADAAIAAYNDIKFAPGMAKPLHVQYPERKTASRIFTSYLTLCQT
jgi:cbb3-type cytochrome oxidase subunit 3